MTLTPWTHENAFIAGTIVRADAMNVKLDGIAQAIQAICNQINQKIPNLPATFTGETQIPEKTLPNTLLLINSAGAMDLYPKAQFDTDVANAASAAAQAATSATNAQTSANQAQIHEQNAEEHAEAAAASAGSAEQAKDDTMAALDSRLGTTGNLGTAAQRNIMMSPTDMTTPDALMVRGAFGSGSLGNAPSIANFNTYQPAGFYSAQPTAVGKPDPEGWGAYVASLGSSAADRAAYLIMRSGSAAIRAWLAKREGGTLTTTELYHSKNAVGVVAQTLGIPTGAIVEAGSNANGYYIRLIGGLQICWYLTSAAYGPVTSDAGLVYSTSITWTYPAQFAVAPTTFYTPAEIISQGTPICWAKGAGKLGATPAGAVADTPIYIFFSQMGGFTYKMRCFAIGLWHN